MLQEQLVSDGASSNGASPDRGAARPGSDQGAGGSDGAPLRAALEDAHAGPLAETVPSDQLWRAAIRAAREAAALAADLRRQLAGGTGADDGPRAVA